MLRLPREGQKLVPLTPFPEKIPFSGSAVNDTQLSVEQKGPIGSIIGVTSNTIKSKDTGRLWHPSGLIDITSMDPEINPEGVELQSISTEEGSGYEDIVPILFHWYVHPGPRSGTVNTSEVDPKHTVSVPDIGPTVGSGGSVSITLPLTVHPLASVIVKLYGP